MAYYVNLIHLRTNINDEREIKSRSSLMKLVDFKNNDPQDIVFRYKEHVNLRYTKKPPAANCRRPDDISMVPDFMKLTPSHYGCYLAHRNAIYQINSEECHFTLICECDTVILSTYSEFINALKTAINEMLNNKVFYVSFTNNYTPVDKVHVDEMWDEAWHQDGTHCYLINSKTAGWFKHKFMTNPWDTIDICYNHIFCHDRQKRYSSKIRYAFETQGMSLLENVEKKFGAAN